MRYFIQFSYDGSDFFGWQKQPDVVSVQQTLEEALSLFLKKAIDLVGAGRTDTGVHAREMFAHFDYEGEFDREQLIYRLNAFLPESIVILNLIEVQAQAHARFDAISRTYEYWVVFTKNPFLTNYAYYIKQDIDVDLMNEAAKELIKFTDFECFSKTNTDVKTFICDLKSANWKLVEDKLVFTITADRFLRNMVRAIVGTLLEIGKHKMNLEDLKEVLASKDRSKAGPSVPAKALFLTKVNYPYIQ